MRNIKFALTAVAFLTMTTACTNSHDTTDNTVVEQKDNPPLDEIARVLYDKCGNQNNSVACFYLGLAYYNGERVSRDFSMSATYFEKACSLGDSGGCHNLGVLYDEGQGVRQDSRQALWENGIRSWITGQWFRCILSTSVTGIISWYESVCPACRCRVIGSSES